MVMRTKLERFLQRKNRVARKVRGEKDFPRLSVFRSNRFIYAQVIDDESGKTLVSASSKESKDKKGKVDDGAKVGEILAKKAIAMKIKKVKFDKSGYKYHGRVAALADGARKGGLTF